MDASDVELDGSQGEGGGQILRSSLALSLLTGRPFHLRRVRAGRAKPGLQPQHLMCVRAAARVGQATVKGDRLRSTDLVFEPGSIIPGNYEFDIGTAGATSLVLHTLYLPLTIGAGAGSVLTLVGGSHVNASPCFHFLQTTWRAYMGLLGLRVDLHLRRPGFYPRGGGVVEARLESCSQVHGLGLMERGPVKRTRIVSAVASLPESIADRQARQAVARLEPAGLDTESRQESWPGGPGTMLAIILDTKPVPTLFFGLGARGKLAERVADEAADQAIAYLEAGSAPVDSHSADQIVLPLALAREPSSFRVATVTSHLLTNIDVIRRFVDREIRCEGNEGEPGVVQIA